MNNQECGAVKFCTICEKELPLSEFKERKYTTKKGTKSTCRYSKCDVCEGIQRRAKANAKYAENPEKVLKVSRETYERNKESIKARTNAYYAENKDKYAVYRSNNKKENPEREAAHTRKWRRNNLDKDSARVKRMYESRKAATPLWADKKAIRLIYSECSRWTKETGIPHHVDHIIPLRSEFVCGLHVRNNLQLLTAKQNMAKGTKFDR